MDEKDEPLHIGSCVRKPRGRQKRCEPAVLCFEGSRLGLQGGARKVGCLSPKIPLKIGNVGLFHWTGVKIAEGITNFGRYDGGFWPAGSLVPSHTPSSLRESARRVGFFFFSPQFTRGVRRFFSLLNGTWVLRCFGEEQILSGVNAKLVWKSSFSANWAGRARISYLVASQLPCAIQMMKT